MQGLLVSWPKLVQLIPRRAPLFTPPFPRERRHRRRPLLMCPVLPDRDPIGPADVPPHRRVDCRRKYAQLRTVRRAGGRGRGWEGGCVVLRDIDRAAENRFRPLLGWIVPMHGRCCFLRFFKLGNICWYGCDEPFAPKLKNSWRVVWRNGSQEKRWKNFLTLNSKRIISDQNIKQLTDSFLDRSFESYFEESRLQVQLPLPIR